MKATIRDRTTFTEITLIPETVEETATLMRMAKNYKKEPADIRYDFWDSPICNIVICKISENNQTNIIHR